MNPDQTAPEDQSGLDTYCLLYGSLSADGKADST